MKLNKRSGFTLLEIIIVIIIVGVLASLALPRFFATVEFSRSMEALTTLGEVRRSIERCSLIDGQYTECGEASGGGFDSIDFNPEDNASTQRHFSYAIAGNGPIVITATRNTYATGDATSTIVFTIDATTGAVTKSGTGVFASIR